MVNSAAHISFHFLSKITLQHRTDLKQFVAHLFKHEHMALEQLTYIFCSDAYLIQLNRVFLNHNTYTDIISFQLSEPYMPVIGEIYISADRVKSNAISFQTTLKEELHRVIFHGALHLCGYQDKTIVAKGRMQQREDYYLNQYFVSRNTVSKRNF